MNHNIETNSLFNGALRCDQYVKGYRFSIDSVLLAHFVTIKKGDRLLDIGTGSGIISLILLYRYYDLITVCSGVELQKSLFDLAQSNISKNNFEAKNKIFNCDIKYIKNSVAAESYDTVVCNPPFYPPNSGRGNPTDEIKIARHQREGGLADFIAGAAYVVKNRGFVYFIYPADHLIEFLAVATAHNLEGKNLRFIYNYPGSTKGAKLVLIKMIKNGGKGLVVSEPLFIYSQQNGSYTPEVNSYYNN